MDVRDRQRCAYVEFSHLLHIASYAEVTVFSFMSFRSGPPGSKSRTVATALSLLLAPITASVTSADSVSGPERVRGFFCNAKDDSVNFLVARAGGENDEMAANAVNKTLRKSSCAYYLPADAIYTGEHTVIRDGLVFKLHSYMFLPERVERWSGSVFGSLQPSPNAKRDV